MLVESSSVSLPRRPRWLGYPAAVLLVGATIAVLKLFPNLADSSVALLLLLAVFACAWLWESGPGVVAAIAATLGFNFFFIAPLYAFTIDDPRNVTALFVFLVSGLLIGHLSATSRERLRLVEVERSDLANLTGLSQAFLSDTNRESLLGVAASRLQSALGADNVWIYLADEQGSLFRAISTSENPIREDLAEQAFRTGSSAVLPLQAVRISIYLPIPIGLRRVGVLVVEGLRSSERMAEGCAVLLGLALERERFVQIARAAEETKASEQMKSTMLAALAHDLKTPVAATRAAVENWAAETGVSERSQLAVEQMQTLTRRISELMDVVRLDSGVARPRREIVACAEIVEASVTRFGDSLARHSLVVEPAPFDVFVEVDPGQLTEALGHGLENAARYSPEGSEIRVSIAAEEGSALLRVADRGDGVPGPDRERVFERFVRLPSAQGVPGTGLGLNIARSLVELNGGALRLSGAPGGGTLFEIQLPITRR